MISPEVKRVALEMWGGHLVTSFTVLASFLILPQPTWYQALLLAEIIIISLNYKSLTLIKTFKQTIVLGLILLLFYNINKYWVYGVTALIVLLVLYRIYKDVKKDKENKSVYLTGVRDIETRLFGKPLEKKYWRENKNE